MKESQKEIKDRMEESQKEIKDTLEESQIKMEESQKEIKGKLDESRQAMEEGLGEMRQEVSAVKKEISSVKWEMEEEISCVKRGLEMGLREMEEGITTVKQEMEDRVGVLKTELMQTLHNKLREISVSGNGISSRSRAKPPTFDKKIPWSTYLRQFEAACEINYWTEQEQATALTVALRGDALNILQTIPESVQKDYNTLVAQMDMRFGDRHMQPAYQMQLRTRTQKNGETLQEFESEIARLLRLSYPTAPVDFLEQIGVETFINGIRDADTQQALLLARHKTLSEALGHELEFEAAKQASRSNLRV